MKRTAAGDTETTKKKCFRILMVDDHPIVRYGLRNVLESQTDFTVCAEAGDAAQALHQIRKTKPHIVLIDIRLGKGSGLELIKEIHALWPNLPMLALSMHDEMLYAEQELSFGCKGYLMKISPREQLIQAIRDVLAGRLSISRAVADRMLKNAAQGRKANGGRSATSMLSEREREIFSLIGGGLGPSQIAAKLDVSVKTVEAHRGNIKRKLGVGTASQLVQRAIQWTQSENAL